LKFWGVSHGVCGELEEVKSVPIGGSTLS